eukprot:TRINITY_DN5733_c0_g1_i1.p3 TRINITY_DN5733_c0_g1~~TRINITY_DN5733_c0_g1_i1.p3  ORF type:complete len:120 (+),score=28.72 TRINITY_DN5733_c0_g1_i1:84-443(+)
MYVNTVEDALRCDKRGISTPLVRKHGHVFLECGAAVHYTMSELNRLHRHFNHPQLDKLAALLQRADGPKVAPGDRAAIAKITAACDVCQRLARAPGRYRVAMPADDTAFNRVVYLDLIF